MVQNDHVEIARAPEPAPAAPSRGVWLRRCRGSVAVAVVLAAFWALLLGSVREKSLTADEAAHAAAGYSYWKFNDYRLNPENGNLPQRMMALPLVAASTRFPPRDGEIWRTSDAGVVGDAWFHDLGNDFRAMLLKGRATMGLLMVALGALVWHWARRLFGPPGGMVALLLFVTSPTILANGALMASDATAALFFLAATFAAWSTVHRITVANVLGSSLLMGGLFLSKMSAVLIIPISLILVVAHLATGRALWLGFGLGRSLPRRWQRALALAGAAAAHALLVPLVVWAAYGFRYSAFVPDAGPDADFRVPWHFVLGKPNPILLLDQLDLTPDQRTHATEILRRHDQDRRAAVAVRAVRDSVLRSDQARRLDEALAAPAPGFPARVVEVFRRHELLPEAFLYGAAHTWRFSRTRAAFFNGEYGAAGWKSFFPYTVLVKTPLAFFGIAVLAAGAGWRKCRLAALERGVSRWRVAGAGFYATLPLWALLAVYWLAAIPSHLAIGHRYVLPAYPPMFVLCGAAAWWLAWPCRGERSGAVVGGAASWCFPRAAKNAWGRVAVGVLLLAGAAEAAYRYPHYLAYFNGIIRPANAYRHLVDSSLDWGQDLPGVKRYMDAHGGDGPFYLSYFGAGRPESYGISAQLLICGSGIDEPRTPLRDLHAPAAEIDAYLTRAKQAWPGAEIVARLSLPGSWARVVFLQPPVLPVWGRGTYLISATMLPTVWSAIDGPFGPWNARFEARYQELRRAIQPLLAARPEERRQAFAARDVEQWIEVFEAYAQFRFARLTAYLRQREPDDEIGHSILVYKLGAADVARAIDGPPPELGEDVPERLMMQLGAAPLRDESR